MVRPLQRAKKEFGDFQTPPRLANKVVSLVGDYFGTPQLVVEPTAGVGTFLRASAERWGREAAYRGYEINQEYVERARKHLSGFGARIYCRNFFEEDWTRNLKKAEDARVLVIGNPPWITNSDLGQLGSKNHPKKSNLVGLRGLDAITGKSNFDIAEWMLIRLMDSLPSNGAMAMLCKTMTARKVLRHFWKNGEGRIDSRLFLIDAKTEFDVSVDACLFFATGKRTSDRMARVYSDLGTESQSSQFGFVDGGLVSNIERYLARKNLDGGSSTYAWRSGIKHDAAKVMEFTQADGELVNGFGEIVNVEDDYVFPLLKSSDIGNGRLGIRKSVLVTQKFIGDDTAELELLAPKLWHYLIRHAGVLDGRKSSIYDNRPRFSVFGVGPYSFAPWKVAVSGLYKTIRFSVVPPHNGRPVMVDDTCYFVSCQCEDEARLLNALLASPAAEEFLKSLIFVDSKRPVTIDVLRRLSFSKLALECDMQSELARFTRSESDTTGQLMLPLEVSRSTKRTA